jgi:MinD-like ATPase involved in chromosome partitioning or flagellar assembly
MLHIAAIELHATGRHDLVRRLNSLVESAGSSPHLIPPIAIRPVAPEEAAFVHAPEVVIVGPLLCEESPDSIRRFRSLFPDAYLLAMINEHADQLGRAEALASRGVNELMSVLINGVQFMQRIIVLNRSLATTRRGKLILIDGAKGGVGATSVAAGIGETLASAGYSAVLVDLDSESQDLARFLGARPFLNDALQLILNQQSPLTEENISQALVQVGDEVHPFSVVPPVISPYTNILPTTPAGKSFLAFLQMVDTQHDFTIVDLAHAGPELRSSLLRGADKVVLVVNGSPSTLHSAVQKIVTIKGVQGDFLRLKIVENASPHSLPSSLLRTEIGKMTGITDEQWCSLPVPYSRSVAYWPGSFSTPASIGCKRTRRALASATAELIEGAPRGKLAVNVTSFQRLSQILSLTRRSVLSTRHTSAIPAISYLPPSGPKELPSPSMGASEPRLQSTPKPT